ncbi:hypothetical protein BYT27DRAFT_7233972 [Phlegmacium glaucopus]|nr:hypothetical protein BYT27DRAFT_7233972 [Phlegmacium glaucopus]
MSNGSPTAYLLWAILSCIFFGFLLGHLWVYDRFNCLKWNSGRQPGAFRRVMTYSYVTTLPLLVLFNVSMTTLKFKEGFFQAPTGQIIPHPLTYWAPNNKHWLLPLYFVLSIAWSLELVTHLEELAFWLFLLHQGPGKDDWFHSWEFRTWYLGSIVAILGMPLTVLASRRNLELIQAWIFLAGSSAATWTTVCFLYVLARFPGFLRHVKEEGAKPGVVARLTTFYHLNKARVLFRFLYTIPLLILAIDAVGGTEVVVRNSFAFDFLLLMGGIGCFVSSAITLLIFFPITYENDKAENSCVYDPAREPSRTAPHTNYSQTHNFSVPKSPYPHEAADGAHLRSFRFPINHPISDSVLVYPTESQEGKGRHSAESQISERESDSENIAIPSPTVPCLTPNYSVQPASRPTSGGGSDNTAWEESSIVPGWRQLSDGPSLFSRPRKAGITVLGGIPASEEGVGGRPDDLEQEPATASQLHPYVINFTSPIDLSDQPLQEARLHAV